MESSASGITGNLLYFFFGGAGPAADACASDACAAGACAADACAAGAAGLSLSILFTTGLVSMTFSNFLIAGVFCFVFFLSFSVSNILTPPLIISNIGSYKCFIPLSAGLIKKSKIFTPRNPRIQNIIKYRKKDPLEGLTKLGGALAEESASVTVYNGAFIIRDADGLPVKSEGEDDLIDGVAVGFAEDEKNELAFL